MKLTPRHTLNVFQRLSKSLLWLLLLVTTLFALQPQLSMDTGEVTAAVASENGTYQLAQLATGDLRDKHGRLLGKIKRRGNGKFEGRDPSGRLMGTYDPRSNETRKPAPVSNH